MVRLWSVSVMLMVVGPFVAAARSGLLRHHGASKTGLTTSGVVHILGSGEQEVVMPTISWEQALAERPRPVSRLSDPTAHRQMRSFRCCRWARKTAGKNVKG